MGVYKAKSWQDKLNVNRQPEIETTNKTFAGVKAGQKMLIPTPKLVDQYIKNILPGTEVDFATLRKDLAELNEAEITCPLTSGIFLRIVAEAAYEEYQNGKQLEEITPFWRVIDEKSKTAQKLSFGTDFIIEQRKKEKLQNKNQ